MSFKEHIDSAILAFPSLYRDTTYQKSRLLVLEHIFLVIGNGYEWTKDGKRLVCSDTKYSKMIIPKGYFTKNLWEHTFNRSDVDRFTRQYKKEHPRGYLFVQPHRHDGNCCIFECDTEEEAKNYARKYPRKDWPGDYVYISKANRETSETSDIGPYPISDYSGLSEMIKGRTEGRDNGIKLNPAQEYIKGAIDIAWETLLYYIDDDRCQGHHYHYSKEKRIPLAKSKKIWNSYRAGQLKILRSFLTKYDPNFKPRG